MLVVVRQFVEDKERILHKSDGIVRLHLFNLDLDSRINAPDLVEATARLRASARRTGDELLLVPKDRKLRSIWDGPAPVLRGELPGQVVESRTQVVQAIPNENRPTYIRDEIDPGYQGSFVGLLVRIGPHSVVCTLKGRGDLHVERLEMLVGPVKLGVDTVSKTHSDVAWEDDARERERRDATDATQEGQACDDPGTEAGGRLP
jgi:hypothetical protein